MIDNTKGWMKFRAPFGATQQMVEQYVLRTGDHSEIALLFLVDSIDVLYASPKLARLIHSAFPEHEIVDCPPLHVVGQIGTSVCDVLFMQTLYEEMSIKSMTSTQS